MGNMKFFEHFIESKLRDMHCGYIGRVISTDGITAKVQPLGLMTEYGSAGTKTRAVVSDVPVACKYKFTTKTITYMDGSETKTQTVAVPSRIAAGDLVACLCADWNITAARNGKNELPPSGMHSISDSIIVGILEG